MRQPEPHPQEGRGCIVIDGALVTFDAGRMPARGELAVVITRDRKIIVAPVPAQRRSAPDLLGEGLILIERQGQPGRGFGNWDPVVLIGAVV
ncbi:hypothetical protein MHIMP23_19500 [Methylobacterium hispanicum]